MSKRTLLPKNNLQSKKSKNWSLGLIETMKDDNYVVKKTENVVIIKDKYPKAKIHYLVLPTEEISSIFKLNSTHIKLLEEFGEVIESFKEQHKDSKLVAGFHAAPSMQRLHMHIISTDMISPCLKTKIHWNSFTTKFFLPYKDVLRNLKENGNIEKITPEQHKSLMGTPLKCNQCDFVPKNMPHLKEHLIKHD